MSKSIVSEGKTTAEAIEKGLKAIGLPKELVEIKVIEENKKSFFDILAPKIVKVEIKEKEAIKPEEFEIETTEEELKNAKSRIDRFLKEFVEKLNNGTIYNIEIKDKCLYVSINGENVGNLIGYRGDALYALENILKAMANQNTENRVIVRLDIEGYKEKRIKALQELNDGLEELGTGSSTTGVIVMGDIDVKIPESDLLCILNMLSMTKF